MPDPSPLTQGITTPIVRHGQTRMGQMHALHMIKRIVTIFIQRNCPDLHLAITDGAGSVTIHVEVTHGSTT